MIEWRDSEYGDEVSLKHQRSAGSRFNPTSFNSPKNKRSLFNSYMDWLKSLEIVNYAKMKLIRVFGFDGYEPVASSRYYPDDTASVVTSDQKIFRIYSAPTAWPLFLSILALPSRPTADKSSWKIGQFFRNIIGGWNFDKAISIEKKTWQIVGMVTLVKPVLIPLIKIITWPVRLAINLAKFSIFAVFALATVVVLAVGALFAIGLDGLIAGFEAKPSGWRKAALITAAVILGLVFLASAIGLAMAAGYGLTLAIGLMLLRPQVTVRLIRETVINSVYNLGLSEKSSKFIGGIAMLLAIGGIGYYYAIIFPVLFTVIGTYAPLVAGVAKLPLIAPSLAIVSGWIAALSQIPFVAAALKSISGAVATIGASSVVAGVGAFFAAKVTALAALLGVQAPAAATLAAYATIGLIAAPVGIAASWVADNLSNRWVMWAKGGPITDGIINPVRNVFSSLVSPKKGFEAGPGSKNDHEMTATASSLVPTVQAASVASAQPTRTAELFARAAHDTSAENAERFAAETGEKVESQEGSALLVRPRSNENLLSATSDGALNDNPGHHDFN